MADKTRTDRISRRVWLRRETYFLTSFFLLFILLSGILLYHGQSQRRESPATIGDQEALQLASLAVKGLAFEYGISLDDLVSQREDEKMTFEIHVDDEFPMETFLDGTRQILSRLGYEPSAGDPPFFGRDEMPAPMVFDPKADLDGAGKFELVMIRRKPPLPSPEAAARMAIVIDDLGRRMDIAEALADLPAPLTFSIMPRQPVSREVAALAAREGKEVLMHLPMEPMDYPGNDPGPGALMGDMTEDEISRILEENLTTVPGAVGINNHMGSRLTADKNAMDLLMPQLASRGLIFLDSRTSPDSVAYSCAKEEGLSSICRDVFLDHEDDRVYIRGKLDELMAKALDRGHAVGIGHPRENTLVVLRDNLDRIRSAGIDIVPLSELTR
jgi:polysaccharide deacetylase 2 family uncharacterized protein YibQ